MLDNIDPQSPVSKEQIALLRMQLREIPKIRKNIENAERAGMDMTEQRTMLDTLEKQAKAFVQVYGNL